jgi:hypothetical protein
VTRDYDADATRSGFVKVIIPDDRRTTTENLSSVVQTAALLYAQGGNKLGEDARRSTRSQFLINW